MADMYETKITTKRWMACDIPGNVGWIIYLVCCYRLWANGARGYAAFASIPAILMIVGVIELISERIARLDRVLPKIRLLRGFGALTLGGVLGAAVGIAGLFLYHGSVAWWMLAGGFLCALFAGLIWMSFQKRWR